MAENTVHDMNPNTTNGLSAEMKTYYSDYLIDNAVPNLVHDQFGQKHPIPANGGKTINFRKFIPFGKASKPLCEGVTPDGGSLSVTNVTAEVSQYGFYVTLSDMLMLTSVDNTLVETTRLLGSQAGSTLDTVTREVLNSGTNVMYAGGVSGRCNLGEKAKITVDDIYKAARFLKSQNTPRIDGGYVAIIHPDVAYDLMRDPEWIDVNKYADSVNIFNGEIGKLAGVRFVESTESKIFHADDVAPGIKSFRLYSYDIMSIDSVPEPIAGKTSEHIFAVAEGTLSVEQAVSLVGKRVQVFNSVGNDPDESVFTCVICGVAADGQVLFIDRDSCPEYIPFDIDNNVVICSTEAGLNGRDVYSTLIFGANAYGVTEVTGGGLEHIVKQLGSGGTADPLNQRATAGWKGTKVAELLVDNYLIRMESASTFESGQN